MPIARLENYKVFMTYGPRGGLIDVHSSSLNLLASASYTAATSSTPGAGHDDAIANVEIGFRFNFDGTNYSRMFINSNGVLIPTNSTPQEDNGSSYLGFEPNDGDDAFPKICPFWGDWRTAPFSSSLSRMGGIYYGTAQYGLDGHKVFIVRFKDQRMNWTAPKSVATFEAVFHSTTNIIEFNYAGYENVHVGGSNANATGVPVIMGSGSNPNTGLSRMRHCLANTHPLGGSEAAWSLTSFEAQYPGGEYQEAKLPRRFIFSPPKSLVDVFSTDESFTGIIS